MEKRRLIGCLVVKDGLVVQSINFQKYFPVGRPEIAIEFLNGWGIDEIVLLDIDATAQGRPPDFAMVERVAQKCFVPLTVGGGIHSLEDMRRLIRFGADKIAINTAAIETPNLIREASAILGNQCIVISMDVRKNKKGKYEVYRDSGQTPTALHPVDFAQRVEKLNAGEIFLTSIERDGSKKGYDLELIRMVSEAVSIPVIACGGVGHPKHFVEGFKEGQAMAIAAANYFHFTEHSVTVTKAFLKEHGIEVRLDSYATYEDFDFDETGRIAKRNEKYLEKLRFEYQPKEVI